MATVGYVIIAIIGVVAIICINKAFDEGYKYGLSEGRNKGYNAGYYSGVEEVSQVMDDLIKSEVK